MNSINNIFRYYLYNVNYNCIYINKDVVKIDRCVLGFDIKIGNVINCSNVVIVMPKIYI